MKLYNTDQNKNELPSSYATEKKWPNQENQQKLNKIQVYYQTFRDYFAIYFSPIRIHIHHKCFTFFYVLP